LHIFLAHFRSKPQYLKETSVDLVPAVAVMEHNVLQAGVINSTQEAKLSLG